MRRENDILKRLALEAKQRLRDGGYRDKETHRKQIYQINRSAHLNAEYKLVVLHDREDELLYEKIKSIIESDELILNPLGRLVDKKYFDSLDCRAKERYIMSLSNKYLLGKERYEREKAI